MHKSVKTLSALCVKVSIFCTGFVFNNAAVNNLPTLYTNRTQKLLTFFAPKNCHLTSLKMQIMAFIHAHYNNYYIK